MGKIPSLASILNKVAFSKNLLLKTVSFFFFFFLAKEEEKQKLLKWSSDLKQEREQLEQKVKQLSSSISVSRARAFSYGYIPGPLHGQSSVWLPGRVQVRQLTNTGDFGWTQSSPLVTVWPLGQVASWYMVPSPSSGTSHCLWSERGFSVSRLKRCRSSYSRMAIPLCVPRWVWEECEASPYARETQIRPRREAFSSS